MNYEFVLRVSNEILKHVFEGCASCFGLSQIDLLASHCHVVVNWVWRVGSLIRHDAKPQIQIDMSSIGNFEIVVPGFS